ncbi:MAG: hypothetical protein P4L76_18140 [Beijerinckiaceae bacterium]|nr:hypothetical protein [Beijerinckiaceae bacterium]
MKKPKPPKSKQPQARTQPQPQIEPKTSLPWQVLHTWWGMLVAGLAMLGTIQGGISTFDFFHALFQDTKPDIQIAGDGKTPFALPLVVKNKSRLFAMTDIKWRCGIEDARTADGSRFSQFSITWDRLPTKIEPDETETYPCNLVNGPVTSAIIVPIFEYKTLWFSRSFSQKKFTWYGASDPPRWVASGAP